MNEDQIIAIGEALMVLQEQNLMLRVALLWVRDGLPHITASSDDQEQITYLIEEVDKVLSAVAQLSKEGLDE